MKLFPRAGLFAMIAGAGVTPWIIDPMSTFAWITLALSATIAAYIVKDRWFS